MIKCKSCGNDSHCGVVLRDEKCCGESMNLICPKCDCELCNENTERQSER